MRTLNEIGKANDQNLLSVLVLTPHLYIDFLGFYTISICFTIKKRIILPMIAFVKDVERRTIRGKFREIKIDNRKEITTVFLVLP